MADDGEELEKAHAAGVKLPFGSGAGPFPHGTQGDMFGYFVKWGMTPADSLRTALTLAADVIGWSDRVGTIEKGKFADLVAVSERSARRHHRDVAREVRHEGRAGGQE